MAVGGTGAGGSGGTAGMGASGGGGFDNPGGGAGGECCASSTGGVGGSAMGTGGSAGMSMTAGAGGVGGMGGAGGGAPADSDGGMGDTQAPILDCEERREVLQLAEVIGAFPFSCSMEAPAATLVDGLFSLAVTTAQDGADAQTAWSEHKASYDQCGDDQSFVVDNSLGTPRLILCPALCDALTALSEQVAQDGGMSVAVEIIYGCEPPE